MTTSDPASDDFDLEDDEAPTFDDPDLAAHLDAEPTREQFKCTDTGNAERLVKMYADRVRYCRPRNMFFVWDNTRWAPDRTGVAMQLTKNVVRSIYGEAERCKDDAIRQALAAWAHRSESKDKRAAMLELAKSEPALTVLPEALDSDRMLLNCPNGTIDLRTGMMREHRKSDLLTKRTAARFDPDAKSELWTRVVREALGADDDLIAFFQRACGYTCSGDTREEKLFMSIGPTRTSKSTTIQSIRRTLGEYARTADFEAFVKQQSGGGPRNEIARLAGAHMVVSIEVDKGKHLAQGLLKTLTGGDEVTARFLYQEAFEWDPRMKLWLVCNDAPHVPDDDAAMWERIVRIPFLHQPAVRDPRVKEELYDVARSGPAILAWLVEGCVLWQAQGLGTARAVQAATTAYRDDENPLADFIRECCVVEQSLKCTRADLRAAYERWVHESGGRHPLTGRNFNERIRKVASEATVRGTRWWVGLGLLSTPPREWFSGSREQEGASDS